MLRYGWLEIVIETLFMIFVVDSTKNVDLDLYPIHDVRMTKKGKGQCEPITIPMCKGLKYNMTRMPNMFGDESQRAAGYEAHQYYPLVELNCSGDLQIFLCSVYVPICLQKYDKPLPPCRSLCERVKQGCEALLQRIKLSWPNKMNCSQFPQHGNSEGQLCIEKDMSTGSQNRRNGGGFIDNNKRKFSPITSAPLGAFDNKQNGERNSQSTGKNQPAHLIDTGLSSRVSFEWTVKLKYPVTCKCGCRKSLHRISELSKAYFNQVSVMQMNNCVQPCHHPSFSSDSDRKFTTFWLGVWTVHCMVSTFIILATFSLQPARYRYPERPIIFMSLCYFMISLGFLLRLGLSHELVACDKIIPPSSNSNNNGNGNQLNSLRGIFVLRHGGSGPALCTVVFILIYYFGMAASCWWMLLTLTWFLAAGLKWGCEAISKYAQMYHFVAWSLPGIMTILALTLSAVDGDPVGGLCYVGSTNTNTLISFVVAPLVLLLLLGVVLLFSGFASLVRIRKAIKQQHQELENDGATVAMTTITSTVTGAAAVAGAATIGATSTSANSNSGKAADQLEKLMVRIGVFGVLYVAPAVIMLSCYAYELYNRESWLQNMACNCYHGNNLSKRIALPEPSHAIFMLKYFMFLGIGTASGCWVWSRKTLRFWRDLIIRLVRRGSNGSRRGFCGGGSGDKYGNGGEGAAGVYPQSITNANYFQPHLYLANSNPQKNYHANYNNNNINSGSNNNCSGSTTSNCSAQSAVAAAAALTTNQNQQHLYQQYGGGTGGGMCLVTNPCNDPHQFQQQSVSQISAAPNAPLPTPPPPYTSSTTTTASSSDEHTSLSPSLLSSSNTQNQLVQQPQQQPQQHHHYYHHHMQKMMPSSTADSTASNGHHLINSTSTSGGNNNNNTYPYYTHLSSVAFLPPPYLAGPAALDNNNPSCYFSGGSNGPLSSSNASSNLAPLKQHQQAMLFPSSSTNSVGLTQI